MLVGTGKEQDAWSVDDQPASIRVSDGQGSFSEHVKITGLLIEVGGDATEAPGVKHSSGERESFEERG
jgi:hypothetical protein